MVHPVPEMRQTSRSLLLPSVAIAFALAFSHVAAAQVIKPVIPDRIPGSAWFAAAKLLELSDAQEQEFARLAGEFAETLERRTATLLPGHPSVLSRESRRSLSDAEARDLTAFFEECRRVRALIAADIDQVFATFAASLDESQLPRMERARRLVRRHAWLESLDSVFVPGIAIDLEAWLYAQYSDELFEHATDEQRAFLDGIFERYSAAAGPTARAVARLHGETIAGSRLILSGRTARIGDTARDPADGLRFIAASTIDRAEDLLDLNRRLVRDIVSAGIPGVSDAMLRDWLSGTVPPAIGPMNEPVAALESMAAASPTETAGLIRELASRQMRDDRRHAFELQDVYLACHVASARGSTNPYAGCPETCEELADLMIERITAAVTTIEEALAVAEAGAPDAGDRERFESALTRLGRVRADLLDRRNDFHRTTDRCGLIGRIRR